MPERKTAVTVYTGPVRFDGWIDGRDLFLAVKLLCCGVAALAPPNRWRATSRFLAQLHVRARGRTSVDGFGLAAGLLGTAPDRLQVEAVAEEYLEEMEAIRDGFLGGWNPHVEIDGKEVLDDALRRNRGAVLWVGSLAHSDLVAKKALAAAGYRLHMLSAASHPYSASRMGAMLLNPVRLRTVNRYLAKRVIVVYGTARPAMDALREALAANECAVIQALGTGLRKLAVPFFGGTLGVAFGAPQLAHETGAALIPAFVIPTGAGGYRLRLGPDLNAGTHTDRDSAVRSMALEYVSLLEAVVRSHPAAWTGWFHPATWRPGEAATVEGKRRTIR
jgi:lauroyl/myristoyl acyltransferase